MKIIRLLSLAGTFVLITTLAGPAAAQAAQDSQGTLTTSDVQRLEDAVTDASHDITQLQQRNGSLGSQLLAALDDVRDEATYLKVKLRKGESVPRREYLALRDRIDDIRAQARGGSSNTDRAPAAAIDQPRSGSSPRRSTSSSEIPAGTELDVRLQDTLSSKIAQVEDRFEATTIVDLRQDDRVLIPAGSTLRGIVTSVNKAGRLDRKGSLTVEFDRITVKGKNHPLRATVTQALESEGVRGEAGRIGAGAGVGAIIGGILGGFKGALAGILIGGGGTIAATEGKDVELPVGTVLRVRLDSPLDLR